MAAMVNDGSGAHRGACDSSGTNSPGGTDGPGDQGGAAAVRVLLVDDEALMRSGLRLMIDGARGIEVIGEAADGHAALEQTAALGPDVVLMDIRMPRMTGLEALAALRERGDQARVVMLTAFDTDEFLLEALRSGAEGFLLKDSPPEEVVEAVLAAAAQRPRFSPEVLRRLVRLAAVGGAIGTPVDGPAPGSPAGSAATSTSGTGMGAGSTAGAGATSAGSPSAAGAGPASPSAGSPSAEPSPSLAPAGITEREWDVARLVAQGLANPEIGASLFMSVATVKTHLGRLYQKLQVTNRVQLAIAVLELGG
ncbi:response regulator transcription factor [Brachybacterium paraconglomeratum]|uniref:response regulator transcription factor n=1 Tax=Brachybacterium paraconglomeratum TaxID=173362 RepID=UPI0022AFADE0|nr:response regulator transcription factor [Brachybacterium paraconglomeratum]MCZ4325412.1 response regulator transcription factor [Brachybacterium paraconglomeratum]